MWACIENEQKCKNKEGWNELKDINFDNCMDLTNVQIEDACNKLESLKLRILLNLSVLIKKKTL